MLRDGSVSHAAGAPPLWLGALQMAEAWGTPPWEVMEHPGSLKWAARWAAYQKEKRWVEENR